jgi:hypothetical protein
MRRLQLYATKEQLELADDEWRKSYSEKEIPQQAIEANQNGSYNLNLSQLPANHKLRAPPRPSFINFCERMADWGARSADSRIRVN